MKFVFSLLLAFIFSATTMMAQMTEKDLAMSEGVQNAFVFELKGEQKKAQKLWERVAKDIGKLNRNRKAKEYVLNDVVIPAIDSEYPITVYAKFDEFGDMTRGYFWLKMDDRFLNSTDDEMEVNGAQVFFRDYAVKVEKEYVKEELKNEEKALRNLEKDLEKLVKRNNDLHKDIQKAKETIARAEADIEKNIEDQESKKDEIEDQAEKVKDVSDKLNRVGKN